jgi:hypothetical protein
MEYVIVSYPEERDVFIDGQHVGKTNQTLEVETGTHTFSLGEPPDYTPPSQTKAVTDTNPIIPMEFAFTPAGGV